MRSAHEVAKYFLFCVDRTAGDTISSLKLQKLVYYAQAWSMALRGKPMFIEPVEAWMHGPVVRSLYNEYKSYRASAIPLPKGDCPTFDTDEAEVLTEVWNNYGELSARQLEHLTHQEEPWIEARGNLAPGASSDQPLSLETMQRFYGAMLVG